MASHRALSCKNPALNGKFSLITLLNCRPKIPSPHTHLKIRKNSASIACSQVMVRLPINVLARLASENWKLSKTQLETRPTEGVAETRSNCCDCGVADVTVLVIAFVAFVLVAGFFLMVLRAVY